MRPIVRWEIVALLAVSISVSIYGTWQVRRILERNRAEAATQERKITDLHREIDQLTKDKQGLQRRVQEVETEIYEGLYPAVGANKAQIERRTTPAWSRNRDREIRDILRQLQHFRMDAEARLQRLERMK